MFRLIGFFILIVGPGNIVLPRMNKSLSDTTTILGSGTLTGSATLGMTSGGLTFTSG
jgi:hypothetical protein